MTNSEQGVIATKVNEYLTQQGEGSVLTVLGRADFHRMVEFIIEIEGQAHPVVVKFDYPEDADLATKMPRLLITLVEKSIEVTESSYAFLTGMDIETAQLMTSAAIKGVMMFLAVRFPDEIASFKTKNLLKAIISFEAEISLGGMEYVAEQRAVDHAFAIVEWYGKLTIQKMHPFWFI